MTSRCPKKLGYSDSNQEKQDQNLLCYHYTIAQTKRHPLLEDNSFLRKLGYSDSNQEKQDQNLLCYHYTIAQNHLSIPDSGFDCAKVQLFHNIASV